MAHSYAPVNSVCFSILRKKAISNGREFMKKLIKISGDGLSVDEIHVTI
jgi:hypothetical protein